MAGKRLTLKFGDAAASSSSARSSPEPERKPKRLRIRYDASAHASTSASRTASALGDDNDDDERDDDDDGEGDDDDDGEPNLEAEYVSSENEDYDSEAEDSSDGDFVPRRKLQRRPQQQQQQQTTSKGKGKGTAKAGGGGREQEEQEQDEAQGARMRTVIAPLSSDVAPQRDFSRLKLKADHATRPLWINPANGHIVLEAFHALAPMATDFLVAVAEPVSRPLHVHEYKLTPHSLYAAVSVGLRTNDIIEVLNRMSKVPVPESIADFVRECTKSYGKVKLVLKRNKHYVESAHPDVLRTLLRDDAVASARVVASAADHANDSAGADQAYGFEKDKAPKRAGLVIPGTADAADKGAKGKGKERRRDEDADDDPFTAIVGVDRDDDADDDEDDVHAFEIRESEIERVRRRCLDLDLPMMEEYDFRHDELNPTLEMDLKPTTTIRPYQEKSLGKMFSNGRARSGIIVLPCGAGKTLVGITAACTIRKSCIVLCTSGVSVMQWRQQFLQWSTVQDHNISVFTADHKEKFTGDAGIVVSTYSMVANRQKRSHDSQKMMDWLTSREWGFVLLDEVHVVPAAMFRRVVTTIKAHCKLGLTATLVREDDKIDDLNFLIGPKLYEANWMDLAQQGHIANVQCAEVWCPMTPEFYREYLREKSRKRMLLYCMNPNKFQAAQYLIKMHEERGDKVIVFSDNVYALEAYAKKLKKLYIHGGTPQVERLRILQNFQHNPAVNTIFLSKVGDTSIDLPEATCLIQISSHFGSRRQEAQRLGRILRAKRRNDEGFNAFFYSLVSKDTQEIFYSTKRQGFLIDQGYAFKVITELAGIDQLPGLVYATRSEQIELLQSVLLASEHEAELGTDVQAGADDLRGTITSNSFGSVPGAGSVAKAKRVAGSLAALSGGQSMAYVERNRSANKQLARDPNATGSSGKQRNKLFAKRAEQKQQRQRQRANAQQ